MLKSSKKSVKVAVVSSFFLAVAVCMFGGAHYLENSAIAQGDSRGGADGAYLPPALDGGPYGYGPEVQRAYMIPQKPTSGVDAPFTHMIRDNYSGDSRLEAPYVRMHADPYGGKSLSTPWIHIDNWGGGLHLRSPFFRKDIY